MRAALDSNASLGCEQQLEYIDIGRITRNSHPFNTSDELYILRRADLTSLAEHVAIIDELIWAR